MIARYNQSNDVVKMCTYSCVGASSNASVWELVKKHTIDVEPRRLHGSEGSKIHRAVVSSVVKREVRLIYHKGVSSWEDVRVTPLSLHTTE